MHLVWARGLKSVCYKQQFAIAALLGITLYLVLSSNMVVIALYSCIAYIALYSCYSNMIVTAKSCCYQVIVMATLNFVKTLYFLACTVYKWYNHSAVT